jgi:hypothetical protein
LIDAPDTGAAAIDRNLTAFAQHITCYQQIFPAFFRRPV